MAKLIRLALIAALFLTLAVAAAVAAGKDEGTTVPAAGALDKSQYYEITLYSGSFDPKVEQYADQNSFRKFLKQKFNFGYKTVGYPGDAVEKTALMLAADDYPDLVRIYTPDLLKAYVKAGALIELGPLIDQYGPNFRARWESYYPVIKQTSGMDDGKLWWYGYGIDNSYSTARALLEWQIRSDILEQQGYPKIVTELDLLAVLKKGLQDNPSTDGKPTVGITYSYNAGISGPPGMARLFNLGKLKHQTENANAIYDFDRKEYIDTARYYTFKDGLKFWNLAYREGVLDREFITDTNDALLGKMKEGRALSVWFRGWLADGVNKTFALAGKPYRYVDYPIMLKSMVEKGEPKTSYLDQTTTPWNGMAMTKNAKYPARLMEVLDYLASEEGAVRMGWGELGKQYTVQNGKRVPTQEFIDKILASDPVYPYTFASEPMLGGTMLLDANGQNYSIYSDADVAALTLDPKVKEVMAKYGWKNYRDMYYNNKNFKFLTGFSQDFKNVRPTLTDVQTKNRERIDALTAEYVARLVVADSEATFEKLYQEWLDKRDGYGMQDILATWNKEYAALRAKYNIP